MAVHTYISPEEERAYQESLATSKYAPEIPLTAEQPTVTNTEGGKQSATLGRFDLIPGEALVRLAQVFEEGAQKYSPGNWKKIPGYQHLNHALEHLAMLELGRDDEDHLGHALCRISMAVWAEQNRGDMHEERWKLGGDSKGGVP